MPSPQMAKEKGMEHLVDEGWQLEKWRYCWRLVLYGSTLRLMTAIVLAERSSFSLIFKPNDSPWQFPGLSQVGIAPLSYLSIHFAIYNFKF